jgi:nucleolin
MSSYPSPDFSDDRRLSLRRSALRILTSSPSTFASRRTLTSLSSQALRAKPSYSLYQRRWASTEEETPISKLQPTPQQEVENAIHEDAAEDAPAVAAADSAPITDAPADVAPADSNAAPITDGVIPIRKPNDTYRPPKRCVYIGNLFFDITEEDLSKEMARFGQIDSVRLMRDSRGLSKG